MRRLLPALLFLALLCSAAAQDSGGNPTVPAPDASVPAIPQAAPSAPPPAAPAPAAIPLPALPAEIRPGDALLIRVPGPESGANTGEAVLRTPTGAVLQRAAGFRLGPEPGWTAFVFGLATDAPAGIYTVEIPGGPGILPVLSRHAVTVRPRDFRAEDIPLSTDLTSLRTEPSPRKDEESRVYATILGRVDPEGVWLDGPFLRPVASERRTSRFGDRRRYLYATGGTASAIHAGIDFAAPTGTPVTATGRGRVVLAADREVTGKTVVLEHLPGVYTIYMHLDTLSAVPGAVLERGAILGTVGSTGLATGPHLHWELRVRGVACDPETPAFADFPGGP
jgi:hypothetical protein